MERRKPTVVAALVAVVAVLGACTSQPSAKAVAQDIVEGLPGLSQQERDCMTEKLDGYGKDELNQIGENNEGIGPGSDGDEELQRFTADLAECMSDG